MDNTAPVRQQVNQLVAMYTDHKALLARQADCQRQLAKAKIRHEDIADLQAAYDDLATQMQLISDTMTYASPSIWILYKYEAYADEPQSIRTMQDFRQHCSKPGYICTKRFDFLNAALVQRGAVPLTDVTAFPDTTPLVDALPAVDTVESDDLFMRAWHNHEYYREGDRVAKWENV